MTSPEFKALLEKYSRNECTSEEEKLINDWYDSIGTAEPQQITPGKEAIESHIWAKINPDNNRNTATHRYLFAKIAAAIAAVAISGAVIFNSLPQRQIQRIAKDMPASQIPRAEKFERVANTAKSIISVRLPDGSTVRLKPNSEISYANTFDGATREVYLVGEAFFDVHRDVNRPFRVFAAEVVTQVLGTSFNVKAWKSDKEITVAVKSGKVSVYANPAKSNADAEEAPMILVPNQQAVYDRTEDRVTREVVAKPEIILPQSDLFRMNFDETPVAQIFDVLEENYGIDIEYDKNKLEKCSLTTAMSDEGLFERIDVICRAISAKYQVVDGRIVIESPGCE